MAQDSPGSGLTGLPRTIANKFYSAMDRVPDPIKPRQDTSWHDSMVRDANKGFRDAAAKKRTAAPKKKTRTAAR